MSMLSNLGKNIAGVAKVAAGFAAGGPMGAVAAGASMLRPGGNGGVPAPQPIIGVGGELTVAGYNFGIGGQIGKTTTYSGSMQTTGGTGAGCPRGYHLNKHALPASHRHGAVGPRSICVRNRHVNALNGRAAQRALRRLKRADKMTRKIHSLFHRRPAAKARKR